MISPRDLFHKGRHMYCFRNYERTDRELELGDGTTKVFINTHGSGDDILPELKNFLGLINGEAPADAFCEEVHRQVQKTKLSAETRRNFMEFEYMQMLARKDAMKAGREEGHLEILASLVQDGILSLSDAAKRSGMSEEKLKEWIQHHEKRPSLKHA